MSILSVWNGGGVADPEARAGPKIAARGCREATPGTVRSLRAARLSRRPARVSWGRHKRPPGCRVGTRVPSHILGVQAREGIGVG